MVYRVVAEELEGFLAEAEARGHPLPSFVESTFRNFLTCGVPAHRFIRVHCDGCGHDRVVAFSCKRRGVCNSCGGRRMAETAVQLVDRVLPAVPPRQWVLSLPFPLRYRLAYDRTLATPLLATFLRAVFASLRRRARERYGVGNMKCGAVTFLQRFGGALNLNVHFHSLLLDGVYEVLPGSRGVRFLELPPPDTHEVLRVLADTVQRIARIGNAALAVDSVDMGPSRCAALGGFLLHAGVAIGASDRAGLERVCRYTGRPPLACERLERLSDGRILYRLRHRWRDGTSALAFEPREFMARLAAQVPPPRAHQVRYHGVLAPCAAWRPLVVPASGDAEGDAARSSSYSHDRPQVRRARRIAWSDLLRRVFAVDALRCDRCGSKMRVIAALRSPAAVAALLGCIGRAGRSPPAARQGGSAA